MGLWPWKSESAKKCVTTYPSNELAPKMNDAKTYYQFLTTSSETIDIKGGCEQIYKMIALKQAKVTIYEAIICADLDYSSKYSFKIY